MIELVVFPFPGCQPKYQTTLPAPLASIRFTRRAVCPTPIVSLPNRSSFESIGILGIIGPCLLFLLGRRWESGTRAGPNRPPYTVWKAMHYRILEAKSSKSSLTGFLALSPGSHPWPVSPGGSMTTGLTDIET